MTKRVQLIRHDNAGSASFKGKRGELTVNTGNKSVHVHDDINAGGTELARADLVNVAVATAANVGKMSAQQAAELAQALLDIVTNTTNITSNDVDIAANLAAILINDTDIATNASGLATEITDRTNADTNLQNQVDSNDTAIATNVTDIATNVTDIADTVAKTLTNTNKLAGIEAGADVTDTANVTSAGALMDSEVDADLKTLVLPASTTISAFGRTLVDDAAASNARTTMELGGLAILNSVNQGLIDANSVGQSEIKTTYQEVSVSVVADTVISTYFTPSGGIYILGATFRASVINSSGLISFFNERSGVDTSNVSKWKLTGADSGVGSFTAYGRLYYINSSPPYDLGFGNIPLFIFLLLDNVTQAIETVSVSTEAPWHYNGKTNITPSRYDKKGNAFIKIRQGNKMIEVPLTQEIKNADMNDIPHPFNEDLTGKTVIVINPQANICEELLQLHEAGESVAEMFHEGHIKLGTIHLNRGFHSSINCFDISYT